MTDFVYGLRHMYWQTWALGFFETNGFWSMTDVTKQTNISIYPITTRMKSFLVSKALQEQQKINANFKHYFWTEEQDSADQNKPSFLFVLMERGEIDLETIVKNLKDSKSFTPSKGQLISECIFQKKQRKNLTNFCPRI